MSAGLVSLLAAIFCLTGPREGELLVPQLVLLGGALVLELTSVPLAGGRQFSLAAPLYLAAAAQSSVGSPLAIICLAIAITLRALLSRQEGATSGLLMDFASASIALAAPGLFRLAGSPLSFGQGLLASAVVYLILLFWLPAVILKDTSEAVPQQLRLAPLTVGGFLLLPVLAEPSWSQLFVLPLMWACGRAAGGVVLGGRARQADRLERQKQKTQSERDRLDVELQDKDRDLRMQTSERELMEDLGRAFVNSPDLKTVFIRSFKIISRLVEVQSLGFFRHQGDGLEAFLGVGPFEKEMRSAHLLELTEPLIDECWNHRKVVLSNPSHRSGKRIFENEQAAVAYPLGELGVLYAGCLKARKFSRDELRALGVVVDQTYLAALAAIQRDKLKNSLAEREQLNLRLSEANQRLGFVLEGAAALAASLDPTQLLKLTAQAMSSMLPGHTAGAIAFRLGRHQHHHYWPAETLDKDAFEAAMTASREARSPLAISNIKVSRLERSPFLGTHCLLVIPVLANDEHLGAIMVGHESDVFSQADQDAVSALAVQLGSVLQSCGLFEQLKESQSQLVQSSKMAAVGQLSAGIAHEINTPLAAIRVAVQAARRNAKKGQVEKCESKLERAENSTRLAQEIISKLLIFSRRSSSEPTAVDVSKVIADAVGMVGSQLAKDGVVIKTPKNDVSPVMAHPNELLQVMLNLLLNARDAIKAAKSEKPVVTISLVEIPGYVEISVADNGDGISDEAKDRLFEPFFTTKVAGEGTGLGLSVSLSLVESYHGTLTASNLPDTGAKFVVKLPTS